METIDEEEIKEQLDAEMAKFEDDGYFRRLLKMFVGLGRSRNSPEYKEAIVELQRQTAPLLAILLPILVVATLFVVTAVSGDGKRELKVEMCRPTSRTTRWRRSRRRRRRNRRPRWTASRSRSMRRR